VPSVKSPVLACFVALALTSIAAGAAAPTPPPKLTKWQQHQQENYKNSAPADEYFGRAKMSYLGMNNTFRDSAISSGAHTTDPGIIGKVALAEDALTAWERKFPHDPQLARTYYLASQVERKIWVKANQERAWVYLNRLVAQFGSTYFGKLMKRDLAIGFTEHYYAAAVPCAPAVRTEASPAADQSASPAPAPPPTPSPGPTETTLAKGLRVQIIPQPCIPPPSPAPSPSPSPPALPAPAASTSPSPDVSATP
jgi:hypothetical protein